MGGGDNGIGDHGVCRSLLTVSPSSKSEIPRGCSKGILSAGGLVVYSPQDEGCPKATTYQLIGLEEGKATGTAVEDPSKGLSGTGCPRPHREAVRCQSCSAIAGSGD